ncbi:hypothetical protein ACH5RR_014183 [Cinchona calisaya]|uniref:Uncharacterized protein n=1 Tax=Cinchona calisaya TaxID=153742 RepID=A0ABD3A265_9GENT
MGSIRFAGLVIGFIIVSLTLKYSSACGHHEGCGRKGKWLAGIATQNHASSQNMVEAAGRKGLRASKMRVYKLLKRESESKQRLDEKPKISGNYAAQDASTRMGLPNSTASNSHQDASKAFLDAADEVVNLMRKDYGGKDRPRMKPPINNHEPTD